MQLQNIACFFDKGIARGYLPELPRHSLRDRRGQTSSGCGYCPGATFISFSRAWVTSLSVSIIFKSFLKNRLFLSLKVQLNYNIAMKQNNKNAHTPYKVSREKWSKLSLLEQMGNIGSEVGRTYSALQRKDNDAADAAMERALDLFDATISDTIRKSSQIKEILRSKEEFLDSLSKPSSQAKLEEYFTQYAIAARNNR